MDRVQSIFGKYARRLQMIVDERIDRFKPTIFQNYFSMGSPVVGLTYAGVIGRNRIEAAASVVAHGSESPLRSRAGLEKYQGEVASIKVMRQMDEAQYRDWRVMQALPTSDEARKIQTLRMIWEDVGYVGNAVMATVDNMCLEALNLGRVTIDSTTNPDGYQPGTIDLLVPSANKTVVGTGTTQYWNENNLATAKPITHIKKVVRDESAKGNVYEKILMHPELLWFFLENTQVINLMKGLKVVTAGEIDLTLEMVNSYLRMHRLPYIELVDKKTGTEKDGKITTRDVWNKRYVTFVPAGLQGTVHNSIAIEEMAPVSGVAYAKFNSALISKWAATEPFGEFTRGEIIAFPALETADAIHILDTASHTTFGG
jgi:hypothetical protein